MSNQHQQHDCPYCWRVLYSKGARTRHINDEHWQELEAEAELAQGLEELEALNGTA